MSDTVRWTAAAWILSLLAGCGSIPAAEPEAIPAPAPAPPVTWDRELPEGVRIDFRDEESPWWIPVRVLDDATGLPVPGARVDNWWEADWPDAEPWTDCLAQSGVTDEDGYVLMRNKVAYGPWFYVDAPGYAALGEMSFEEEHRLRRGRDFTVEVRDWFGRPIAGADLEYILGCGHTPAARVARTGEDGRAVFPCVGPFPTDMVWIRAEGAEGRSEAYGALDQIPVERGTPVVNCEPGPAVSGIVRHHDGSPAAGAYVGTRSSHRGPWTVTGPDGRFRLLGAPPWERLTVDAPPPPGSPEGTAWIQGHYQSVPGADQVVPLPPAGEDADFFEPEPRAPLRVRARAREVLPYGKLRVVALRAPDGRAVVEEFEILADPSGDGVSVDATLRVPPGTWTVTVGTPAGLLTPDMQEVDVGPDGAEAYFRLYENPVFRPAVLERRADGSLWQVEDVRAGSFAVLTEGESEDATPTPALDGTIHVPQEGPFVVVYAADRHRKARALFPDGLRGGAPAIVLPPAEVWIEDPPDGTPRPGAFPEALITVLFPDGTPAAGARVTVRWVGPEGESLSDWFYLDGNGTGLRAFRRGELLEVAPRDVEGVEVDPTLPRLRAVVEGPGSIQLRWPSTEITLRVVDPEGNPVEEFTWYPGGYEDEWVDGDTLVLRGAPTGPLRFWIHSEGWRARDVRLAVTEGEKRTVTIRMETPELEEELPEIPEGEQ